MGKTAKEIESLEPPYIYPRLAEIMMRNSLSMFELGMSIWRAHFRFFVQQLNALWEFQNEYNEALKDFHKAKSSSEIMTSFHEHHQKLAKDIADFTLKSFERNWDLLNDCINLMLDVD
jgi:hypothetical protein